MFTGLVAAIGTITHVERSPSGREFRVSCPWTDLAPGESIAVNGACLTVRTCGEGWFTVAAVATTEDRTTVSSWREGTRVNLERALRAGDRLGGHMVQGHVDGVGRVLAVTRRDSALLVDIAVPAEVAPLLVPHGSIAIDGVSLTVNALPAPATVQVSLVEWTERHTTLGQVAVGDAVHVEGDVVGKHVQALLAPYQAPPARDG